MKTGCDTENMQKDFNVEADAILEYVCENLCKIPVNKAYTQDDVDAFCAKCRLEERVKSLKAVHEKFYDDVDKMKETIRKLLCNE